MLEPGRVVGGYRVEARIGTGTMGEVWRVRHLDRGTLHALKYLPLASASVRERLLREAGHQAGISHPNVVAVTEVLDLDGDPGLVLELVNGPSLAAWLDGRQLTSIEALALLRGVVAGVARAHRAGIVHRDLKPDNVLLARTPAGLVPKVADFGLAKALDGDADATTLTRTGAAVGAALYCSPEQLRDPRNVDVRADVFSLGCLLYELLCGLRPFAGHDPLAVLNAVANGDYPSPRSVRPDLAPELAALIDACLAPDRDARPASAGVVLERLDGLQEVPAPASRRVSVAIAVGVVVGLLAGTALLAW